MSMCTLQQASSWLAGSRLVGDGSLAFDRVHSDTRSLQSGDLFVALKGERFDANDFLAEAQGKGAVAAIAHRGRIPAGFAGIEVDDATLALGALAAGWRAQFELPLIAVTGSNGKTTVTQMIAAILRAWHGDAALATQKNFNNEIGLPLTLLRLRTTHRAGVLELGMNHPGEIGRLSAIARPTVGLVNNAQREHQEFMVTVEAVARENGAVLAALPADGVAVFPADDAFTPLWTGLAGARSCMTFSMRADSASRDGDCVVLSGALWQQGQQAQQAQEGQQEQQAHWRVDVRTSAGPLSYRLCIAGLHNVHNSLAAVACSLAAGVPTTCIEQGLNAFLPVQGRSSTLTLTLHGHLITLVDDSYNANPDSVRAAIDLLASLPGPRLLVLGDMGEVGGDGARFHGEMGEYAAERGIEQLFTLGEQSTAAKGRHFQDIESLAGALRTALPKTASVLVKGSRFMKMERAVQAIVTHIKEKQGESPDAA